MSTAPDTAAPPVISGDSKFGRLLLQLVGEPFLFARVSYGDEVVFHFGDRLKAAPRVAKAGQFVYEHGTHRLLVRGSAWLVKSGTSITTAGLAADVEKFAAHLGPGDVGGDPHVTEGAVVTGLNPFPVARPGVDGFGLRVDLSDGATMVVIPTPEEDVEEPPPGVVLYEVADWELVTPAGRLTVGPGKKWHWQDAEPSARPLPSPG